MTDKLWQVNLDSSVAQYGLMGLKIYIKALEIIKQFLEEKNNDTL